MPQATAGSGLGPLRARIGASHPGRIGDARETYDIAALAAASCAPDQDWRDRTVLVRVRSQLSAALALIELDGAARRIVLCPPDLDPAHLPAICIEAGVDAVLHDSAPAPGLPGVLQVSLQPLRATPPCPAELASEWVMFTSGTTGRPKMVRHSLAALTGAIAPPQDARPVVWSTFYDIRRYGGLQILLRALTAGASLVLSDADEATADFLVRAGHAGVTHISGTPSHWRRALMSPALHAIAPRNVRLSGEIADQAVLDALAKAFPDAAIGHAYASTEAGVGFEVTDGRAGFPIEFLKREGEVRMKLQDGSLRIRSRRTASDYLGEAGPLMDADGYVDTQDMVEQVGDRLMFAGRREGLINVGGLKVHPEEVEAVINRQPGVRMSRVQARRSPITGALVTAEIVAETALDAYAQAQLRDAVLTACRAALPPAKAPASIRIVEHLALTAGGKLERRHA